MRTLLSRLRGLILTRPLERHIEEELHFHLDMEAEKKRRRGMKPEDSAHAARRAFGSVAQTKESYRDQRGLPTLEMLLHDLQYAFRMIRRSPAFTAITVFSLALGIGANTAIFTLVDAVLLRSLPVRSPQELVSVGDAGNPESWGRGGPSVKLFSLSPLPTAPHPDTKFHLLFSPRDPPGALTRDSATATRSRFAPDSSLATTSRCSACRRCSAVRSPTRRTGPVRWSSSATTIGRIVLPAIPQPLAARFA